MPDERIIARIEQLLNEIITLGGKLEQTAIVTNVTVIDAAPTAPANSIIIEDPRDGDYVPALKLPGIVYANGDLINVLFIEGTEPVALGQGSDSSGEAFQVSKVYDSTFTNVAAESDASSVITFHDDIALDDITAHIIGVAGNRPDLGNAADVTTHWGSIFMGGGEGITSAGDITFTAKETWTMKDSVGTWAAFTGTPSYFLEGRNSKFPDLGSPGTAANKWGSIYVTGGSVLDSDGSLNIQGAAAGEIVINDSGLDVDLRVEASGVSNAFFVEGSSSSIGIGTSTPNVISAGASTGRTFNLYDGTNAAEFALQGSTGGAKFNLIDLQGAVNQKWVQAFFDGDFFKWRSLTDDGTGIVSNNILIMQASNGRVAVGNFPTTAQLFVNQTSTTAAIPVVKWTQADVDKPFLELATTIGTGNAIEAVGAKTLTPTHFVMLQIPGGLIRYFEVGTIA